MVLLVREPRAALVAEFHRDRTGDHVGVAPRDAFDLRLGSAWRGYVADRLTR